MCRIRLTGDVTLEVFPNIESDDLTKMVVWDRQGGDELDIVATDVSEDAVVFCLVNGRSSSLPLAAVEVIRRCADVACELAPL